MPPVTSYATLDTRTGGSTPAESVPVWDFDASAVEYVDLLCQLIGYAGGGVSITLVWLASSATSGDAVWGIGIRRLGDGTEDVDAAHTYDFNEATAAAASAAGEPRYTTITFADGGDMDGWADGELAIVRIRRNASHAGDTMSGDAELLSVSGKEA